MKVISLAISTAAALAACTPSLDATPPEQVVEASAPSSWHVVAWVDEMNDFPHVALVGDSTPAGGTLSLSCTPGGRSVDFRAEGLYLSSVHDPVVSYRFDKRPPVELEHWFALGDTASPGAEQEKMMLDGFDGAKSLLMEVGGAGSSAWSGRFNLDGFSAAKADYEARCASLPMPTPAKP